MLTHLLRHLEGQVGASIVHGQQNRANAKLGIQMLLDHLNILEQLTQALEGVVLALNRNQDLLGRHEGVHGKQTEARRAVDKYVVEARHPLLLAPLRIVHQGVLEAGLSRATRETSSISAPAEVDVGGCTEQTGHIGTFLHNLGERLIFDEHVIDAGRIHAMLNAQSGRRITLRVVIDDKNV